MYVFFVVGFFCLQANILPTVLPSCCSSIIDISIYLVQLSHAVKRMGSTNPCSAVVQCVTVLPPLG